ncbi:EscU/YscU/HrcU family type III secretion system export apparatus switch protein, partial [Candidatus Similichlamydia epinepheli]|uniref:EscU/YscU/HrcU family type III secretion system export apparatus switch protein n=1 Tax=Candidatus Similichlamydia epinepheli TaxID=1903953 RepID=UPI002A4E23EE
ANIGPTIMKWTREPITATPKKLRDARKKGQVAKSQDIPGAATFVASIGILLALSSFLFEQFAATCFFFWGRIASPGVIANHYQYIFQAIYQILVCSIPFALGIAVIGSLVHFIMVGPMFATEIFKFDIKKFDPVNNLKQKFKLRTLVELLKSTFKVLVSFYICYKSWLEVLGMFPMLVAQPLGATFFLISTFLWNVVVRAGFFFVVVALADYLYQKRLFDKEMMMEKFELKQEFKNTEGDPELKSRRREVAREIAYGGGRRGLKGSKVVLTNPTHIAVALAYEHSKFPAPFIVARGKGVEAEWIVFDAKKLEIPIVRNVPLAWALYEKGELHEFIPFETYEAVAEVLRWVASLESGGLEEFEGKDSEDLEVEELIDENLKGTGL